MTDATTTGTGAGGTGAGGTGATRPPASGTSTADPGRADTGSGATPPARGGSGGEPGKQSRPWWRTLPRLLGDAFGSMTLRSRVGALVAIAVGVGIAATSLAAFFTMRSELYTELDRSLLERARDAATSPLGDPTIVRAFAPGTLKAANLRIALVTPNGTVLTAGGKDDEPPVGDAELAVAGGADSVSVRTASINGNSFRVVAVPAVPQGAGAFVLGQLTEPTDRALRSLGTVLLIIGVSGVMVSAYAGVVVARQGLRPVENLTEAAERVARTGQLRPIRISGNDEIARLGTTFNAMLATIERSHDRQRRLVADAGHELRTPLTSLRTNLDLLAQSQRRGGLSERDRTELLDDVQAQVTELTGLVSDLVELARDDGDGQQDHDVDLADVVATAVRRARLRAPEVSFDVHTEPWTVLGDARVLERAVLNLLDNAGKWSPPGGTVTVRLVDGVVAVSDEGPGIDEADLPFVFERFYRAEESRMMPGSGLGLAIVRQAAERHDGTVTADRAPTGGTLIRLRLPRSSPSPMSSSASSQPGPPR